MGDGVAGGHTEEFLGIGPGDVVAFIGGGGKTTLMNAIAARLVREGRSVLVAATRPFVHDPAEAPRLFLTEDQPLGDLLALLGEHKAMTLSPGRGPDGALRGYSPEEVDSFADLGDYLFVEAEDGGGASLPPPPAGRRPVPPVANVLFAVAGLDALGPELSTRQFAERLCEPRGPLLCRPDLSRRLLLLNKADLHSVRLDGARIAKHVAGLLGSRPVPKVLFTSVADFRARGRGGASEPPGRV